MEETEGLGSPGVAVASPQTQRIQVCRTVHLKYLIIVLMKTTRVGEIQFNLVLRAEFIIKRNNDGKSFQAIPHVLSRPDSCECLKSSKYSRLGDITSVILDRITIPEP